MMNSPTPAHTFFRKDYQPPKYAFESVELDFQLNTEKTIVSSRIKVQKIKEGPLVLKEIGRAHV